MDTLTGEWDGLIGESTIGDSIGIPSLKDELRSIEENEGNPTLTGAILRHLLRRFESSLSTCYR